jgi:hypothetical protein
MLAGVGIGCELVDVLLDRSNHALEPRLARMFKQQPPPKGVKLIEVVPALVSQAGHSYPPASCRNTLLASWASG